MKLELNDKEAALLRFLMQRELECIEHDESVQKPDLRMLGAQETYHEIISGLLRKLK